MSFFRSRAQVCTCPQCRQAQQNRSYSAPAQWQQQAGRQQMPQMPQVTPRQMPMQQAQAHPQHQQQAQTQAPYSDPSVRFEPIPQGLLPPGMAAPAPAPPQPSQAPPQTNTDNLKTFIQGEVNSLAFYQKLSEVSEAHKGRILELIDHKKKANPDLVQLQATEETKVDDVTDFASGISFALLQESRQLRELAGHGQEKTGTAIANKIADIAHLMSIISD
ncbi:MAG: hypothetical protein FWB98_00645 [Defluviitaleaceae bacterium]|nr:hypothetical protein [Defluviitaleaceae bacterium]